MHPRHPMHALVLDPDGDVLVPAHVFDEVDGGFFSTALAFDGVD